MRQHTSPTVKNCALKIKNNMRDNRSGHFRESNDVSSRHLHTATTVSSPEMEGEDSRLLLSHALAFRFITVILLLIHNEHLRIRNTT
jgi:hypothetical protein